MTVRENIPELATVGKIIEAGRTIKSEIDASEYSVADVTDSPLKVAEWLSGNTVIRGALDSLSTADDDEFERAREALRADLDVMRGVLDAVRKNELSPKWEAKLAQGINGDASPGGPSRKDKLRYCHRQVASLNQSLLALDNVALSREPDLEISERVAQVIGKGLEVLATVVSIAKMVRE